MLNRYRRSQSGRLTLAERRQHSQRRRHHCRRLSPSCRRRQRDISWRRRLAVINRRTGLHHPELARPAGWTQRVVLVTSLSNKLR